MMYILRAASYCMNRAIVGLIGLVIIIGLIIFGSGIFKKKKPSPSPSLTPSFSPLMFISPRPSSVNYMSPLPSSSGNYAPEKGDLLPATGL